MKTVSFITLVVGLAVFCGAAGCRERSSALPLSLATLDKIHDGRISFEERGDEIFVHLTDRFDDSHIYRLDHHGLTKEKALEILKAKLAELEKLPAPNKAAPANVRQPISRLMATLPVPPARVVTNRVFPQSAEQVEASNRARNRGFMIAFVLMAAWLIVFALLNTSRHGGSDRSNPGSGCGPGRWRGPL